MQEVGHIIMAIVEVQVIATLIAIVKINLRRLATLAQAVMVLAVSSGMTVRFQVMAAVATRRDVLHVAMNTGAPLSIVMKRAEFVMEEDIKSINNKLKNTMAKKSRQSIGYNPQKVHRFRPSIGVTITRTDETLNSFKEELSKVVLKWLSGKLGVDRKDTYSQTVTFTSNGPTDPNPPSNPQNINIINVIVSCPHVQNCPHYPSRKSEEREQKD